VKAGVVIAIELWWIGSYALPTLAAAVVATVIARAIRLAVTRRTVNIPPRLSWVGRRTTGYRQHAGYRAAAVLAAQGRPASRSTCSA